MASILKEVFTNRNVAVISITTTLWTIFMYLWMIWWSIYLYELGAPPEVIAILGALRMTSSQILQLPGGFLADKIGRKRVVIFGSALRMIYPIMYIFATTWWELIPGQIMEAIASMYLPAFMAMIADSMPARTRGAAYGAYGALTTLPGVFMPALSGIYMDRVGLMMGMKIGFILSFFASFVMLVVRFKFLRETLTPSVRARDEKLEIKGTFSGLLSRFRGTLLVMLIVTCIGSFTMQMVMSWLSIYAYYLLGLTLSQFGLIQTILMAIMAGLSLPAGMLADKWGRKKSILITQFGMPWQRLTNVYIRNFIVSEMVFPAALLLSILTSLPAGLGGYVWAGGTGGPAWSALMADLVPLSDRGKVIGVMATITGLVGMPGATIGAYIWGLSPDALMITSFIGGLIPAFIFLAFAKEPKAKEE